jgi:hypothetical protein
VALEIAILTSKRSDPVSSAECAGWPVDSSPNAQEKNLANEPDEQTKTQRDARRLAGFHRFTAVAKGEGRAEEKESQPSVLPLPKGAPYL